MTSRLALAVAVACLFAVDSVGAPRKTKQPDVRFVLKRVNEVRRADLVRDVDDGFSFDSPGLELTFGVELPDGRRLVELEQPASVRATDSTDRDITAIEPGFTGQRRHLEVTQTWGEPPDGFKFKLALPDRQATWFDLHAPVTVISDGGVRDVVVAAGPTWKTLQPELFEGKQVEVKLAETRHDLQVTFKPGTVRPWIETVLIVDGDAVLKSSSHMWNDASVAYSFDGKLAPGMQVRLTLRRAVERVPVVIELEGQTLP